MWITRGEEISILACAGGGVIGWPGRCFIIRTGGGGSEVVDNGGGQVIKILGHVVHHEIVIRGCSWMIIRQCWRCLCTIGP